MSIVTEISLDEVADPASHIRIDKAVALSRDDREVVLTKHGRFWAVYAAGVLVCVCVYKRGAAEVIRRLTQVAHGRVAQ